MHVQAVDRQASLSVAVPDGCRQSGTAVHQHNTQQLLGLSAATAATGTAAAAAPAAVAAADWHEHASKHGLPRCTVLLLWLLLKRLHSRDEGPQVKGSTTAACWLLQRAALLLSLQTAAAWLQALQCLKEPVGTAGYPQRQQGACVLCHCDQAKLVLATAPPLGLHKVADGVFDDIQPAPVAANCRAVRHVI